MGGKKTMSRVTHWVFILWGVSTLIFPSTAVAQEGPTAQVKATVDRVLNILKDPTLKNAKKEEQRRTRLREAIYPRFDFTEMAKRSLGVHWRDRTSQEQKEFVSLFGALVEQSYYKKLDSYADEKVDYANEEADAKFAVVSTKIVNEKERLDIPIAYKLIRRDGEWKIYDVVVEDVSMVSNYRSQFNSIIQTSSYAELVRKMQFKQDVERLPGPR
jgi:phospholipid transport system substrate-binding protein